MSVRRTSSVGTTSAEAHPSSAARASLLVHLVPTSKEAANSKSSRHALRSASCRRRTTISTRAIRRASKGVVSIHAASAPMHLPPILAIRPTRKSQISSASRLKRSTAMKSATREALAGSTSRRRHFMPIIPMSRSRAPWLAKSQVCQASAAWFPMPARRLSKVSNSKPARASMVASVYPVRWAISTRSTTNTSRT